MSREGHTIRRWKKSCVSRSTLRKTNSWIRQGGDALVDREVFYSDPFRAGHWFQEGETQYMIMKLKYLVQLGGVQVFGAVAVFVVRLRRRPKQTTPKLVLNFRKFPEPSSPRV